MTQIAFRYLDQPAAVDAYLESLRGESCVAVDFEADSLHNYREKICLAQFSTPAGNVVVDPLTAESGFARLGPLLADAGVEKVFHGGDYDVRLVKKTFGFQVRRLFDTAIAAQFTGRTRFGLAALLEEFFGVQLDKRFQRADWSSRPLRPDMLAYAAADTAYLLELRDRLAEELRGLGRAAWVAEEFELLEQVEPGPDRKPWCLDVKGAGRFAPRQLAVLQALLELRDDAARQWDRPPFKVLPNAALLGWAVSPPKTNGDLAQTPGIGHGVRARLQKDILEAVRRACALPLDQCPRNQAPSRRPLTPAEERVLKNLKRLREELAESLQLPPGLVVNTATLENVARLPRPTTGDAVRALLKRWQADLLAERMREVAAG